MNEDRLKDEGKAMEIGRRVAFDDRPEEIRRIRRKVVVERFVGRRGEKTPISNGFPCAQRTENDDEEKHSFQIDRDETTELVHRCEGK